jgi:thioredoxin reductase (NADPH)
MTKIKTDAVIIGAGPVGLFTIFECGMLNMKTLVIDALDFIGGQCTALYPEKPIYDVAGFPAINAEDLIKNLEKQAAPFNPQYLLGQQVVKVETGNWKLENPDSSFQFLVSTSKNEEIYAKVIIIAAGCGAFGPNRPPIENLEEFEKTGAVNYLVRSKEDYRGKKVVIAGGGDSAVDWANILPDVASKVYIAHRRDKFRAAPESLNKLQKLREEGKIEFLIPYQPAGVIGKNGKLEAVELKDLTGNSINIEADNLLCFFGLAMELGPIANWGLNIDKTHIAVDAATLQTNVAGIYAVGDICTYKGKLKLITCGFSEAAMAVHHAYDRVHGKPLHFEYSTSKGVPAA